MARGRWLRWQARRDQAAIRHFEVATAGRQGREGVPQVPRYLGTLDLEGSKRRTAGRAGRRLGGAAASKVVWEWCCGAGWLRAAGCGSRQALRVASGPHHFWALALWPLALALALALLSASRPPALGWRGRPPDASPQQVPGPAAPRRGRPQSLLSTGRFA